jgi:hypothetical protein
MTECDTKHGAAQEPSSSIHAGTQRELLFDDRQYAVSQGRCRYWLRAALNSFVYEQLSGVIRRSVGKPAVSGPGLHACRAGRTIPLSRY